MKTILMMMALALPVMAQKLVWEVKVNLPTSYNALGAITVEQLTADSRGNTMLRLAMKKDDMSDPHAHVVLWVNSRGTVLTQENYTHNWNKQQFQFFFDADKRAMIYNSQGTPTPPPGDETVMGPNIITFEKGKQGITKKIAYVNVTEGLTVNEMAQARMAAYAFAAADVAANTATVSLWRVW